MKFPSATIRVGLRGGDSERGAGEEESDRGGLDECAEEEAEESGEEDRGEIVAAGRLDGV